MQCVVPTHNVISISNPTNLTLMCGEHGQISIDLTTGKVTLTNVTMDESGVLFWAGVIKAFPGVREVIRAEGTK
jgi:uncharacterized membrane protein